MREICEHGSIKEKCAACELAEIEHHRDLMMDGLESLGMKRGEAACSFVANLIQHRERLIAALRGLMNADEDWSKFTDEELRDARDNAPELVRRAAAAMIEARDAIANTALTGRKPEVNNG